MKPNERGIALVITLFLMATLSALAVSMMFLAQTETAASRNYRTMSQARYAAEAGVHELANYLMNTGYVPAANYDPTKSPVTCTGGSCAHTAGGGSCTPTSLANAVSTGCVVVGYSTATTNNPDATVHTPTASTLAVNSSGSTTNAAAGTVTYTAGAILMSMKTVNVYGGGTSTVETWQIVSDGTVPPSTAAIVEVSSTIEREVGFATTYAVFATSAQCSAITINGNASTDSYNSAAASSWSGGSVGSGTPVTTNTNGGIGTNGNLNVGGSVAIGGTLSTPRTGAGACSNSNVDAITGSGTWSYGGTHQLSQSVSYPPPGPIPAAPTTPTNLAANSAICSAALQNSGWACSVTGNKMTLYPTSTGTSTLTLGNVAVAANTDILIEGRAASVGPPAVSAINDVTLVVNSFNIGNNATLSLADGTQAGNPRANVVMEISGQNLGSTKPLDLSGGGSVNTSVPSDITSSGATGYDGTRFQIEYAGNGEIDMVGNNSIAAMVYAPLAFVETKGHGSLYGSVLANTFTDTGGATINYDTSMSTKFSTLGNFMLTSFSWKKY
jgi:Tfp pilus assembly protein PilX